MNDTVIQALFFLPGFVIGLTVHEASHAVTAKWLGDDTAQRQGRVSLNPLRHLSLMGMLALFLIHFGWGKPVPININNFRKPKLYMLLSSLAGPASNLLLSAAALGILYLKPHYIIVWICLSVFYINAMLAVFNLLPIPPLDGSRLWPCIIPKTVPLLSGQWTFVWMAVLFISVYTGAIGKVLGPVMGFLTGLLPRSI